MELFSALGINLKILIAQFINFSIFFFVLYKFAYKPMLKFLDDRKQKIEKGLNDAEKANNKLIELEEKEKEIIAQANLGGQKQAKKIIAQAKEAGEEKRVQMIQKTKEEIKNIVKKEKENIELEKNNAIKDIKKQTADLVAMSLKKVLNEKIDNKKDMEIIQKALK